MGSLEVRKPTSLVSVPPEALCRGTLAALLRMLVEVLKRAIPVTALCWLPGACDRLAIAGTQGSG